MLDDAALRLLFRARLKTVGKLPDSRTRIAWENHSFQPPQLTAAPGPQPLWMREIVRILSETKASTGFIEAIGETLFLIETPMDKGTEEADALTRSVAEAFQAGQSLTSDTLTVILEHTERRPYRPDPEYPAWIFKTVAVRWRTFTAA